MLTWFACTPIDDLENGTRYFQTEPCPAGYAHSPLPPEPVPMLREPQDAPAVGYRWIWHDRGFAENPVRSYFSRGHRGHRGHRR